jgi:predicted dehydrogenase
MRLRILGDRGGIEARGHEAIIEVSYHSRTKRHLYDAKPVLRTPSPEEMSFEMVKTFVESVVSGREPPVTGEQSLLIHAIIDGIYESAIKGEEIKVKPPTI